MPETWINDFSKIAPDQLSAYPENHRPLTGGIPTVVMVKSPLNIHLATLVVFGQLALQSDRVGLQPASHTPP